MMNNDCPDCNRIIDGLHEKQRETNWLRLAVGIWLAIGLITTYSCWALPKPAHAQEAISVRISPHVGMVPVRLQVAAHFAEGIRGLGCIHVHKRMEDTDFGSCVAVEGQQALTVSRTYRIREAGVYEVWVSVGKLVTPKQELRAIGDDSANNDSQ